MPKVTLGDGSGPFPQYPVSSAEVKAAAGATTDRTKAVDQVKAEADKQEKHLLQAVEGTLEDTAPNALKSPATHADDVIGKAVYAAGCLREFGHLIDMFNIDKKHFPRCVSDLNSEYIHAQASNFGVPDAQYDDDATEVEKNHTDSQWRTKCKQAEKAKHHALQKKYGHLHDWLDRKAEHVAGLLEGGPTPNDLKYLYAHGMLPSWATTLYPHVDFDDVNLKTIPYILRQMSKQDLIDWIHDHPNADNQLMSALREQRPDAADDRVEGAEIVSLTSSLTFALTGSHTEKLMVEHLANGQVRITEISNSSLSTGPGLSVKGHLDAGDVELLLGGGLGATGEIGVGAGRTWEVDPGDAETLIRALTAENQAAMGGPHGAVPGANIFTDSLIPEPDRAGISGEAAEEIYSELGLVDSAGGEARHEDGVQLFRERGGDHGIRYSTSDDVNGETHAPLAKLSHLTGDTPTGTATTSRSTEFTFDQDGTPEQVKVQTVHGTGSEQHVSTTTVDLDSDQMRHDAKVLAKAMHNPTEENLNEAADVDVHSWGTGNRDDADLKVGSTDFGGGFELSPLWKGLGASIDIEHTKIDYDYNGR